MELKQEVTNRIKEKLMEAYHIAVENNKIINNVFLQESIISIVNRHCGGVNGQINQAPRQERKVLQFNEESFKHKKKEPKNVVVSEYDDKTESEVKKIAKEKFGLVTAGKSKEQLIAEIEFIKPRPKKQIKKTEEEE